MISALKTLAVAALWYINNYFWRWGSNQNLLPVWMPSPAIL